LAKLLFVSILLGWSMSLLAQTPSYLHVPAPRGARVNLARWAIQQAYALGYEGVVIPVGTDQIQDPLKTDWSGFTAAVNDALKDGLKVHLRLLQNVPVKAYLNGVCIGPTVWVTRYNTGQTWNQPFRPPLALCPWIAKLVWQKATDILYQACIQNQLDPTICASEELTNEPGIRGAGGAYTGDSFSSGSWPALPDGTIEPYFWTMLRKLRYSFSSHGIPTYAVTLEGTAGQTGQTELNSIIGEDAQRVTEGCTGWGFNRYETVPAMTPQLAAQDWESRALAQIKRMRANSLIGNKPLFITEFGMKETKALMTGGSSAAQYRQAVLLIQRSTPGVIGGGWFLSISTNSLGSGFNLFNEDETPVGLPVGPLTPSPARI
jgi:hypothetical protein